MTTATSTDLEAQLDRLTTQVDWMAEQMRQQQLERQKWAELVEISTPITRDVMDRATAEMEVIGQEVTSEDLARFVRTTLVSLPKLEAMLRQLDSLTELAETVSGLSAPMLARLTEILQAAEEKGYFAYAKQTAVIADNVVTEFTEEDVAALGDNVVTILHAVKEMTQPEVMALVQRTAITMQDVEDHPAEPPSMLQLVKQMRDPQTRRGLSRVLAMLNSVGEEQPAVGPQAR
jgi:uncharacterized protein YjgD (DUF1641 family)